jgi:hypothetical protein
VDKKKDILGGAMTNKKRRWLVRLQSLCTMLHQSPLLPQQLCPFASLLPQSIRSHASKVLFGDSLEWYHPDEAAKCVAQRPNLFDDALDGCLNAACFCLHTDVCVRFAAFGFPEGRSKAKPNGKIEFASQDVMTVTF